MAAAFDEHDIQKIETLLDAKPELIYYYDNNNVGIMDYGLYNLDTGLMKKAAELGAVYDDPRHFDNMIFYSSLESFYSELYYPDNTQQDPLYKERETTDEIIEAVRFAIENGAEIMYDESSYKVKKYKPHNFYEQTFLWVNLDETISAKDKELLALVESYMPDDWDKDSMKDKDWAGRQYIE